jgi:ABC-type polysaccharide/polyol phosphate export permease
MIRHLSSIWTFRYFLAALVKLDLQLRYRRSFLGIGWSLLNPIAMTVVFTVVFSGLLGTTEEYAPYLLTGLAVWAFLRDSTVVGCRALLANETYIRQSPLPYGLYTLRTVLGQAIHGLIALGVALGLVLFLRPGADAALERLAVAWVILPGLVLAFLAAWAVATITAFANVYFHDVQHLLEVGSQIMFFATPIMYGPSQLINKGLGWLVNLNPVYLFLQLIRDPIVYGTVPGTELYVYASILTVVLIGLAVGTVAWLQKRVIFHL